LADARLSIMELDSRRTVALPTPGPVSRNLTFAPDGKSLYFIAPDNTLQQYTFTDGITKKILAALDGPFAISPDGKLIFLRHETQHADLDLVIAGADGRNARKVTTLPEASYRLFFPVAETVVVEEIGTGLSRQLRNRLSTIALNTGSRTEVPSQDGTMRMLWPSGKAGAFSLVMSLHNTREIFLGQIWHRKTADAPWKQLTQDSIGFQDLIGASADATIAVKRPMLSDISFDDFVGALGSWVLPGPVRSARHIAGYELVVLHINP
jgi:hypothetical protein